MENTNHRRGFTLIELLIVIAIIAVLATVVILSLNPAQLLRQARDSNRVSDAATLKSAIALYLADVASPQMGTPGTCYISIASSSFYTPNQSDQFADTSTCQAWMQTAKALSSSSARGINGNGWIPIDFNLISSGSPIGQEPIDPTNQAGNPGCTGPGALSSCGLFYSYIASSSNTYKIGMQMESTKYSTGSSSVEATDGGINNYMYEQGSNLSL